MVRTEYRIIFAAIAVFFSVAGMATAIHGLLFDEYSVMRYGVAAIVLGVACFVVLLNPTAGRNDA
jgi:cell shape-determining protein MreD